MQQLWTEYLISKIKFLYKECRSVWMIQECINNANRNSFTFRDMAKPIGLAEYRITESLPENLKTALPTIKELEAELAKDLGGSKDE